MARKCVQSCGEKPAAQPPRMVVAGIVADDYDLGGKRKLRSTFELLVEGVLVSTAHCDLPILIAIIPVGLNDLAFSAECADLGFFPLQALKPDGDAAMEDGGIGAVFHIAFGCKQHLAVVAAAGRAGTDP